VENLRCRPQTLRGMRAMVASRTEFRPDSALFFTEDELFGSRLRSLDGLRGVAALVVLGYHSLLISPTFGQLTFGLIPSPNAFWNAIMFSPLRLLIAGNQAVTVFFVLSGFVLTLQVRRAQRSGAWDWQRYYVRRMVRLFLPAAGSVLFAIILSLAFHHDRTASASPWVQFYTYPDFHWTFPLNAIDLFDGIPDFNSPLWSLKWEVLFSLLLPLYVTLVSQRRRVVLIALALAPAATIIGHASLVLPFVYLPAFLVGAVLTVVLLKPPGSATDHETMDDTSARPRAPRGWQRHLVWALVTVAALLLLILNAILPGYLPHPNRVVAAILSGSEVIGAGGIVIVAARWVAAIRLLESPPVAWLGRVSFSLYLVHAPILIACANLLSFLPWQFAWGTGIVVALIAAQLFSRFVEQPSHHLSQRIGAPRISPGKSVS